MACKLQFVATSQKDNSQGAHRRQEMANEFQWETNQMEGSNYESLESYETQGEQGEVFGELGEVYGESAQQGEVYGEGSYGEQEAEAVFNETQEMELAAELLGLSNEQELEQFLGNLIRSAGRAVGGFIKSPVGQALGGVLKGAARQALPIVGGALGGAIGGSTGANIGRTLATKAGQIFGLELEGLSGEDQEFEVARRYVRFAGAAAGRAARAPLQTSPRGAARSAAIAAARRHAPGLLRGGAGRGMMQGPQGFAARRAMRRADAFRRRPGAPGFAPGYGFPVPYPTGGTAAPDGGSAGGFGGGQDDSDWAGGDQDPASAGGSPDTADGNEPTNGGASTGPIARRGNWTRQGRRITILL